MNGTGFKADRDVVGFCLAFGTQQQGKGTGGLFGHGWDFRRFV